MKKLSLGIALIVLVLVSCAPQQGNTQSEAQATQAFQSNLATALAGTLAAQVEPTATIVPSSPTPAATPTPVLGVGSTFIREADKQPMLFVPEGAFTMGLDQATDAEGPAHPVYLDSFWIDRTEVTNREYAACVKDAMCPKLSGDNPPSSPVVSVPWDGARDYCTWAGARLPTEAEWEKAARGDTGFIYPWGNQADTTRYSPIGWDNSVGPVGSYPSGASPYGALDMAGSAFEWVADWYSADYYSNSPASNPTGPDSGKQHVIRGGWWEWCPNYYRCNLNPSVRITLRNGTGNYGRGGSGPAWIYYPYAGFRCAASLTDENRSLASAPAAPLAPTVPGPGPTATSHPSVLSGAIPMQVGDKMSSYPKAAPILYSFQGTQGDSVEVTVQFSNAHPTWKGCKFTGKATFAIQTDNSTDLESGSVSVNGSTKKVVELPYTGSYYIYAACSSGGCNGTCAEFLVSLQKP